MVEENPNGAARQKEKRKTPAQLSSVDSGKIVVLSRVIV